MSLREAARPEECLPRALGYPDRPGAALPAIRCNQRQSDVIRIPRPSRGCPACDRGYSGQAIRAHQWSSEAIRAHQKHSDVIRGQRSLEVNKGHQRSEALRGPHLRRRIVHKEGLIDGRSPRQSFHSAAHVACEVGDHHESLVARGAQGGQLMEIAISMHSEAQSEASSEASLEAISVPKARTATGDRGRVRGRQQRACAREGTRDQ